MSSAPTSMELLAHPEIYRNSRFKSGLWAARVVNVNDPDNRGRVQVRILQLHPLSSRTGASAAGADEFQGRIQIEVTSEENEFGVPSPPGRFEGIPDSALPWAEPCFPFGGQRRTEENSAPNGNVTDGFFMLPSVGSTVWVAFENGWVNRPVWLGGWYGLNELPPEITDPSNIRLIKTPAGHILVFDDTEGSERVFIATTDDDGQNTDGPRIRFVELHDANQTLILRNSPTGDDEQYLEFDRPNKKLTVRNTNTQLVELDGAASSALVQNGDQKLELDGAAQTVTIENTSTTKIVIDSSSLTITVGSVTMVIDAAGQVTITTPTNVTVNATGLVSLGTSAALGVVLSTFKALFDAHTHSGVSTGGGTSGPPTTQMQAGTDFSTTVLAKP